MYASYIGLGPVLIRFWLMSLWSDDFLSENCFIIVEQTNVDNFFVLKLKLKQTMIRQ